MFVQNKNIKEFCSNTWLANNDSFFHLEAGYLSYLDSRALVTVQCSAVHNYRAKYVSLAVSVWLHNYNQYLPVKVSFSYWWWQGHRDSVITSFYQIIIIKYKIHTTAHHSTPQHTTAHYCCHQLLPRSSQEHPNLTFGSQVHPDPVKREGGMSVCCWNFGKNLAI